jgi:hypothetical protein
MRKTVVEMAWALVYRNIIVERFSGQALAYCNPQSLSVLAPKQIMSIPGQIIHGFFRE